MTRVPSILVALVITGPALAHPGHGAPLADGGGALAPVLALGVIAAAIGLATGLRRACV